MYIAFRAAGCSVVLLIGLAFAQTATNTVHASGRVQDRIGNPLADTTVKVIASGATEATTKTDLNGRYTFAVVPGRYELQFQLSGFKRATLPLVASGASVDVQLVVLDVGEPGGYEVSYYVAPIPDSLAHRTQQTEQSSDDRRTRPGPEVKRSATGTIAGRVIDRGGAPIANVAVMLRIAGTADATANTQTDENGRYSFSGVLANTYDLFFDKQGFTARLLDSVRVVGAKASSPSNIVMDRGLLIDHRGPGVSYHSAPLPELLMPEQDSHDPPRTASTQAGTNEPIITTVCELVKERDRFDGRIVKLRTEFTTGTANTPLLWDRGCDAVIGVLWPTKESARDEEYRKLREYLTKNGLVEATVIGVFTNVPVPYGNHDPILSGLSVQEVSGVVPICHISGRVTDRTSARMLSATVKLMAAGNAIPSGTVQHQYGDYRFAVRPGSYDLLFEAPGFKVAKAQVTALPGKEIEVSPALEPDSSSPGLEPTPGMATGTRTRDEPVKATPCELVKEPDRFSGKMVTVRGRIVFGFENFRVDASQCAEGKNRWSLWLEYGTGAKRQPTSWCCGDMAARETLRIVENNDFRRFHHFLTAQSGKSGCHQGECALYEVTATLTGRFDAVETETCSDGTSQCPKNGGFGHFGAASSRIVIQSVSDVVARPTSMARRSTR